MRVDMVITKSGDQIVIHGPDTGKGLTPEQVHSAVGQAMKLVHSKEWWECNQNKTVEVTLEV